MGFDGLLGVSKINKKIYYLASRQLINQ